MKFTKLFAFVLTLCFLTSTSFANVNKTNNPDGPIIDQFLAMLNGTEAAATAAVKKFGSAEVIANGMIPFGKSPKIIKTEGNCVRVSLTDDGEQNVYTLCEENGKITTFELYFDEEE